MTILVQDAKNPVSPKNPASNRDIETETGFFAPVRPGLYFWRQKLKKTDSPGRAPIKQTSEKPGF